MFASTLFLKSGSMPLINAWQTVHSRHTNFRTGKNPIRHSIVGIFFCGSDIKQTTLATTFFFISIVFLLNTDENMAAIYVCIKHKNNLELKHKNNLEF